MPSKNLTTHIVRTATTNDGKPRKYFDGNGLFLLVTNKTKTWKYTFRWHGKQQTITYGPLELITLAEARVLHSVDYKIRLGKQNPIEVQNAALIADQSRKTFNEVAESVFARSKSAPATVEKARRRLAKYVLPSIGNIKIDQISKPMVISIIEKVELQNKGDTARRVLVVMRQVFKDAFSYGLIERNPTDDLGRTLREPEQTSYPHLEDPDEIGRLLSALNRVDEAPVIKAIAQLLPLIFCRPSELRLARWSEVDFQKKQLVIPAERLKLKKHGDLIIPLSQQALKILRDLRKYTEATGWVFASRLRSRATREHIPISGQFIGKAIDKAIKLAELPMKCQSAHGWRHVATTLLNGRGPYLLEHYSPKWVEVQTHHKPPGKKNPYDKAAYLPERTKMMQAYADLLDTLSGVEQGLKLVK